jgi:hypothetical protein
VDATVQNSWAGRLTTEATMTARTRLHDTTTHKRPGAVRHEASAERASTTAELAAFWAARDSLMIRLPGRLRRRTARVISRW